MKYLITLFFVITTVTCVNALSINEILSNPVGDDSGREWLELYNDSDTSFDLTTVTISIKGGNPISITPVSGGTVIAPHGYAVIGSVVSGATKFSLDYPSYTGPLFKASISLVNTGVTSLEIRSGGSAVDTLTSYTAAKEGTTYSLLNGSFVQGVPTPGEENKAIAVEEETPSTTSTAGTQSTLPQASPPSADITLYLPKEKIVVAGAPAFFSVFSSTHAGKTIDNMMYSWGFGDGGYATGSSTLYRYLYPGRYIAQVEGTNGLVAGTGRMVVKVVSPDITISPIKTGKYGTYIEITNPNDYDLDLSQWKITIDGVPFSFPKNTLLAKGITRFPGSVLGFASTTVSSSTVIRLLFQNMDEVLRITQGSDGLPLLSETGSTSAKVVSRGAIRTRGVSAKVIRPKVGTSSFTYSTSTRKVIRKEQKDARLATFIKSLFSH